MIYRKDRTIPLTYEELDGNFTESTQVVHNVPYEKELSVQTKALGKNGDKLIIENGGVIADTKIVDNRNYITLDYYAWAYIPDFDSIYGSSTLVDDSNYLKNIVGFSAYPSNILIAYTEDYPLDYFVLNGVKIFLSDMLFLEQAGIFTTCQLSASNVDHKTIIDSVPNLSDGPYIIGELETIEFNVYNNQRTYIKNNNKWGIQSLHTDSNDLPIGAVGSFGDTWTRLEQPNTEEVREDAHEMVYNPDEHKYFYNNIYGNFLSTYPTDSPIVLIGLEPLQNNIAINVRPGYDIYYNDNLLFKFSDEYTILAETRLVSIVLSLTDISELFEGDSVITESSILEELMQKILSGEDITLKTVKTIKILQRTFKFFDKWTETTIIESSWNSQFNDYKQYDDVNIIEIKD